MSCAVRRCHRQWGGEWPAVIEQLPVAESSHPVAVRPSEAQDGAGRAVVAGEQ